MATLLIVFTVWALIFLLVALMTPAGWGLPGPIFGVVILAGLGLALAVGWWLYKMASEGNSSHGEEAHRRPHRPPPLEGSEMLEHHKLTPRSGQRPQYTIPNRERALRQQRSIRRPMGDYRDLQQERTAQANRWLHGGNGRSNPRHSPT